jgi:hypothetical protein
MEEIEKKGQELIIEQQSKSVEPKKEVIIEKDNGYSENTEIKIGTLITNYSYDNEKDQYWYISKADKENVTISQKKWGTRNQISPITMKWDDLKSMVTEGVFDIEGYTGDNKRFVGISISNFIKEQKIKEREKELDKKARYERAVKNAVEQRKKQRIEQRQRAMEDAERAKKELDEEIKKEREKEELTQIINLDTELAEKTKDKNKKSIILERIGLNKEILNNMLTNVNN